VSPTPGDWARLSDANAAAAHASVELHLEAGEEALVIVPVRPKGGWASTLTFARLEVTPAAVELPELCALAVSSRRFLVVSHDPAADHQSALLVARPLDEVRSVRLARALGATELSWTAGGTRYALWANGSTAKQVAQALQPGPGPGDRDRSSIDTF